MGSNPLTSISFFSLMLTPPLQSGLGVCSHPWSGACLASGSDCCRLRLFKQTRSSPWTRWPFGSRRHCLAGLGGWVSWFGWFVCLVFFFFSPFQFKKNNILVSPMVFFQGDLLSWPKSYCKLATGKADLMCSRIGVSPSLTCCYGNFWHLFTGLGYCLSFLPTVTILSQYFDKRRSLVTAVASTGECFAVFSFAPGTVPECCRFIRACLKPRAAPDLFPSDWEPKALRTRVLVDPRAHRWLLTCPWHSCLAGRVTK